MPNDANSEHPTNSIWSGQAFVTGIINTIMQSPDWPTTAIFLSWDDWGGFYDHANPPKLDVNGYGIRVPGLVISPYAKIGFIDHQVLSHDAYLKFIEDVFLGSQRLDPATDGRPDSRPDVRESAVLLGDLMNDFDFTQQPRPPLVLHQRFDFPSFLYAANGKTNDISVYSINASTGKLASISGSPFATGGTNPVAVVHDPQARFLFVANQGSNSISAYMVNQTTGSLSTIVGSPFQTGSAPVDLVVDVTGEYLFALNSGSNDIWRYKIDVSQGSLTKIGITSLGPARSVTKLAMEGSGRFLYVSSSATQQIFGYLFNNSNGTLTLLSGFPFYTGSSGGPLGVAVDRAGRWLFSSDGPANTLSRFRIGFTGSNTGVLKPTTPPNVAVGGNPTAIEVYDPGKLAQGKTYVFAVDQLSKSISGYALDSTGTPIALTNSPYSIGVAVGSLACDYWNGYVYVASTGGIWAFKIGPTSLLQVAGSPFLDLNNPQALDVMSLGPVAH